MNKTAEHLLFDEEAHRYELDGRYIPNVTSIIKPLSTLDRVPAEVLARAAERGKAVHKACELHLLGDLDETTLDDEIAPTSISSCGSSGNLGSRRKCQSARFTRRVSGMPARSTCSAKCGPRQR